MTVLDIVEELKTMGTPAIKKVLMNHGAREPFFGVKVGDLKKIQKRIKKDYQLALELYATGIGDAMYLAGLIADDDKMTKKDLQRWADEASWQMISEYTVPWVAAGSKHGWEMALKWIESKKENIAAGGWMTLSSLMSIKPDDELDLPALKKLLDRVARTIHDEPNRVRYVMNGFVIAAGGFVAPLNDHALNVAKKIGQVHVDMGGTACKVPHAVEYLQKMANMGRIGKKKKSAKC